MSGQNRLANSENTLANGSESTLTSMLMNANEVALKKNKKKVKK